MFKFIRNRIPNNCIKHQRYHAYLYSKIVYGMEIYGNASKQQINKLQVLQNKALKLLHRKNWYTSTNSLHKELSLLKFNDIFKLLILKFVEKYRHGDVLDVFKNYFVERNTIHNYCTTNAKLYQVPKFTTCLYGNKTMRYTGAKIYNEMSSKVPTNNEV